MKNKLTEYELCILYNYTWSHDPSSAKELCNPFKLINDAILDRNITFIKLKDLEIRISEVFEYLHLYQRFEKLKKACDYQLNVSKECFWINGIDCKFQTLDEVEKALNNKAFL
jgi:hypothetical protein